MSLTKYTAKRNFTSTPEPKGTISKAGKQLSFVVQRHKASRLHYDFRLEMEGVLKSWAVPKGPSLNPEDKRLAMMVEDHPYAYKDFKGVIKEGYGAGIVEIWDKGTYTTIDNETGAAAEKKLLAGLKAGNLKITLHGKKLKGEFALVKIKGMEDNAWLLIKHRDKFATEVYDSEKETPANSPINKWMAANKIPKKKVRPAVNTVRKKLSKFISPMLAKEMEAPFNNTNWLFEIKWDGYRAIAEIKNEGVELYSRNGNSFNSAYPIVYNALKKIKPNMVLDGEIVVLNEAGKADFQQLQHYAENPDANIFYYVFDLLFLDGHSTTGLSLLQRKALLKKAIKKNNIIRYAGHVRTNGIDFFNVAKANDLEGIMAKKADSEYFPGARSGNWLKIKHHHSEEVVVVGYTQPTGSRNYFGALVLAVKGKDGLKYAGHTGSGFTDKLLKEVYQKLKPLVTKQSPFAAAVKTNMPVTWVKPIYVCEVKFTEWTTDGKMRHPIFLRMREDKSIKDIAMIKTVPVKKNSVTKKEETAAQNDKDLLIGKTTVQLTNQQKIYFPEDHVTKGMVIAYYQQMSDYILPYLKDRPESLKRNPNGIHDTGFFHKDAGEDAPAFVKRKKIFSESADKEIDYIICNNAATLAYLNNLGCIELNPWNSTLKNLDKPDYLLIDIDPSEKNTFEQVIETAQAFKLVLDKAGATAFCKTSGATGLHIYLPLQKKYLYEQVKDFAQFLCMTVNKMLPGFTSMERSLAKRGNKNIYLDYLQNRRGQTIAAPYSLRPKIGATVSTPLTWQEVKSGLCPTDFTIKNIWQRVQKKGDLFKEVLGKGINLKQCLESLS